MTETEQAPPRRRVRRILAYGGIGFLVVFLLIQLLPFGRDHANPPVTKAAPLSGEGLKLAKAACYDCHSNETEWPWYTNVAPMSWLVEKDVKQGREALNFSQWDRPQEKADELEDVLEEGTMPPLSYQLIHGGARLSAQQRDTLLNALEALLRTNPPPGGDGGGDNSGKGGGD